MTEPRLLSVQALEPGTSMGGTRPNVTVEDDDKVCWQSCPKKADAGYGTLGVICSSRDFFNQRGVEQPLTAFFDTPGWNRVQIEPAPIPWEVSCSPSMTDPTRLNWGCGPNPVPGWINSDRSPTSGIDLCCDIRGGLALPGHSIDYAVSIHALQDLPWTDIPCALTELRRVLKPGGVLRLALPDMDRAIAAYQGGDAAYFVVPDEHAVAIGAKLVAQLIWYGSTRTPMNWDYALEILEEAGFHDVRRCAFRETRSRFADIVSLDNRERETLFVEASA